MLSTQAAWVLAFLAGSALVSAHGHVASWTIGGVEKAGFNPSYAAQYGPTAERPTDNSDQGFADWTKDIVACGGNSAGSGLETWDLDAGSTATAHWNTWPDSHKGPVTEYMARCPGTSCDGVPAASLDWFKIQEDNFDGTQWPTETVVKTLAWSFKIPSDLAPGPYLVRHDLVGMHTVGAPQVYPVCFQANLKGSGSAVPGNTAKFPAAYNINPDFKTFDIYSGKNDQFVAPGPPVYAGGGGGAAPAPAPVPSSSSAPAPIQSSSSAPVPVPSSSAAPVPASSSASPVRPSSSAVQSSSSAPAPTSSRPATSSAALIRSSTSSAAAPTNTKPATGGSMGGPAPPVTPNGNRWEMNGGSYNDEASAITASCYIQMNKCKDWANTVPNAEVAATLSKCDTQLDACKSTTKAKREVMARYAKRGVLAI